MSSFLKFLLTGEFESSVLIRRFEICGQTRWISPYLDGTGFDNLEDAKSALSLAYPGRFIQVD